EKLVVSPPVEILIKDLLVHLDAVPFPKLFPGFKVRDVAVDQHTVHVKDHSWHALHLHEPFLPIIPFKGQANISFPRREQELSTQKMNCSNKLVRWMGVR